MRQTHHVCIEPPSFSSGHGHGGHRPVGPPGAGRQSSACAFGLIGFGLIGRFHLAAVKAQPDAEVAAVCDVHKGRVEAAAAMAGGNVARYADFRKLLDDKRIDAVYVATPDHWHALMTMLACAAGKDVYVEKPLTLFVREGRWMLDVARRSGRVVQVGTQNRSGQSFSSCVHFFLLGCRPCGL